MGTLVSRGTKPEDWRVLREGVLVAPSVAFSENVEVFA